MITRRTIESEIRWYESIMNAHMQRILELPEGSAYSKFEHGANRPYRWHDGREDYIPLKQMELIGQLETRSALQETYDKMDVNLNGFRTLLDQFTDIDNIGVPSDRIPFLGQRKGIMTRKEQVAMLDEWAKGRSGHPKYGQGPHTATDHTTLRSRVELAYYEFLLMRNLRFKREAPILIDGDYWYPDFIIIRDFDNAIIIWEHFGMMDDPQYRAQAEYKISRYIKAGYLPYVNLITTFDSGDDAVDLSVVEDIMRMMRII